MIKIIAWTTIIGYFCNVNKNLLRMKKINVFLVAVMVMSMANLASCNGKQPQRMLDRLDHDDDVALNVASPLRLKETSFEKETKYAKVEIDAEYPVGDDMVSANIRKDLIGVFGKAATLNEDLKGVTPYVSDSPKMGSAVDYYGGKIYDGLRALSAEDNEVRNETEKDMAKEEGREYRKLDVMQYFYEIDVDRDWETNNYCVFDVEVEMFNGGAHGSSIDLGGLTYDKRTGKRFTSFLKSSSAGEMQQILRTGLVSYFVKEGQAVDDSSLNDMLQIEGNTIPLPQLVPYPTAQGLVFLYGQYEIAPYAAGKPKFCVPYNKVKKFLTPEAIQLLGL